MADSRDGFDEKTFIKPYDDLETDKGPIRGAEAYPLLEIVQGPKQGAWFTVAYQKEITLGRAATNSIILEDNSVSRSHSVLQTTPAGGFTVRDIGSRNGTFLNEKKIQGEVPLKHKDVIKIGIYSLRYLTKPLEAQAAYRDEATPRVEEAEGTPTEMLIPPEPSIQEEIQKVMEKEKAAPPKPPAAEVPPGAMPQAKLQGRPMKALGILLAVILVLGAGGYTAYRLGAFDALIASKGTPKKKPSPPAKAPQEKPAEEAKVIPPETAAAPQGDEIPAILEVDAVPIQGKVFYKGRELGLTPFKINLQVSANRPQELSAEFPLEKIGGKIDAKETFEVKSQDEVVQVHFKPKMGALNIKNLPKNGQLYLEGKFEGEQAPAKSVQVTDVGFNQPLYLPHGNYAAEIKVPESIAGSETTHEVVRYRREFALNEQSPEFTIDAPDKVLQSFPAKIASEPSGADLLMDANVLGKTPFEGDLPMGRHKLVLKKEGFADVEKEIAIEINTPFVASFNLQTSPAGEVVNKGRQFLQRGMYNEAIEQLAEALKRNPDPTELNQIHMLLGDAFLGYKTYDQALAYYQRVSEAPEYAPRAKLGIAEAQAGLGQMDQALIKILDVVLNTKDAKIQAQAQDVYKRIAPMKSLLYVATDPKGAQLTVNGNPINQPTPVILSDLMVGSYRLSISKTGFKTYETRVTVPVSSIKPIVVKLVPE
jgi:tetratricopeptide (TPR) repeat protein